MYTYAEAWALFYAHLMSSAQGYSKDTEEQAKQADEMLKEFKKRFIDEDE